MVADFFISRALPSCQALVRLRLVPSRQTERRGCTRPLVPLRRFRGQNTGSEIAATGESPSRRAA